MTGAAGGTPDAWWRAQADALRRWSEAPGAVLEDLGRILQPGAGSPAVAAEALREFGARFFTSGAVPGFAGVASGGAGSASGAGLPAGPVPLGPAREHLQRSAELVSATTALAAAQQAQVALLVAAGHAAATAFAARLRAPDSPAARGPRAAFDAWIECAEAAWLDLAHGEAWCTAQARTFDAALQVRACQQAIADHAARLAGIPTRGEVDDLQRRVRDLERAAAIRADAAAKPRRARKPRP